MIESIVRNPIKVTVAVLLVGLFGIIAMFSMPMQLTPEVQTPTLTIETRWPGASPQEVEREIVQEQEKQLKSVEGLTKMTSESMDSQGRITLEFAIGTDMREALLKANTRLQQVTEYPVDADEPVIKTANLGDRPIAWFMLSPLPPSPEEIADFEERNPDLAHVVGALKKTINPGVFLFRLKEQAKTYPALQQLFPPDIDVMKLKKFAEDVIEARFERVKGVSDSQVIGGEEEEMQVLVDTQKLAARGLTIVDVRDALKAQNMDISGGDFWQGKRRWVIRTLGQFRNPKDVAGTIITHVDGAPVYVKDVAEVKFGHKKAEGLVRRFGTQMLSVNAIRETGANVLDVMEGLRQATQELNDGVLKQKGLKLTQVYDETEYIYSAVGLVQDNIIVGGLLTFLVLLLFLRSFRSSLIIGLAIPTSIIGTFLMLYLLGRSLNVISLAGLAFAVGMLVDNAVVVLENIYRHYQMGKHPFAAAVHGAKEVIGAVIASTLTTLAVFIPVIFVQQEAGQLFRDIALAISFGIGLSLIVSFTLVPVAAARLLATQEHHKKENESTAEPGNRTGQGNGVPITPIITGKRKPKRSLAALAALPFTFLILNPLAVFGRGFTDTVVGLNAWLQKSLWLRLLTVAGFSAVSIWLSIQLLPKVEYLPSGNRNLAICILLPPPGYNLDQMIALGEQIETDLRPYWDVDEDMIKSGQLDFPAIGDYFYVVRGRQIFMGVRAADPQRVGELIPLLQKAGSNIPGSFFIVRQSSLFEKGLGSGRAIDVEITGPELEQLIALGGEVLGKVKAVIPEAQTIPKPSLDLSSPEVHIVMKKEQAAEMKMNARDLGYIVDALVDGAYATDFFVGSDKIDLRILGKDPFHFSLKDPMLYRQTQDLEKLPIATKTGELVPLAAIAEVVVASGPEQINHRERQRAITIQVLPPATLPLEEAMELIKGEVVAPMIESGKLEGGLYQINLAGTADDLRATWEALRLNFLLALLITYLLMAALFESWVYPLVIIASVPLGMVGGVLGLWLLNFWVLQPLDVLTMLGFVILIGTVVNNPILIVEQALIHMRDDKMPMSEAVLESVRNRVRPIFMTTITTVFGLLPLVLFPGAGSELYRGLGAVVLGGLLISTIVTLVVIPAFFSLTMDIGMRYFGVRMRSTEEIEALLSGGSGTNGVAAPAVPGGAAIATGAPASSEQVITAGTDGHSVERQKEGFTWIS
jgi:HAE1 family hydrophobic/amphiphilic exporter-1